MNGTPRQFRIPNSSRPGEEISISVRDFGGAGKPIALLQHANGFCAGTWALVARQLTAQFHVLAIDARGHGDSEGGDVPRDFRWDCFVDDLLAVANRLVDESDFEQIDFGIGSSFGGIITAAAEAKQPGLFNRIALLDPPIHPDPSLVQRFGLDIEPVNSVKSLLVAQTLKRRAQWPSVVEPRTNWRTKGMFADWSDEAFELYLAECLLHEADGRVKLKCDPKVEAHIFETTGTLDVLEYAPKVEAPVLYLRASNGNVPAAFSERVASLFAKCTYDEIEGGHLLPLEVPTAVVTRLLQEKSDSEIEL